MSTTITMFSDDYIDVERVIFPIDSNLRRLINLLSRHSTGLETAELRRRLFARNSSQYESALAKKTQMHNLLEKLAGIERHVGCQLFSHVRIPNVDEGIILPNFTLKHSRRPYIYNPEFVNKKSIDTKVSSPANRDLTHIEYAILRAVDQAVLFDLSSFGLIMEDALLEAIAADKTVASISRAELLNSLTHLNFWLSHNDIPISFHRRSSESGARFIIENLSLINSLEATARQKVAEFSSMLDQNDDTELIHGKPVQQIEEVAKHTDDGLLSVQIEKIEPATKEFQLPAPSPYVRGIKMKRNISPEVLSELTMIATQCDVNVDQLVRARSCIVRTLEGGKKLNPTECATVIKVVQQLPDSYPSHQLREAAFAALATTFHGRIERIARKFAKGNEEMFNFLIQTGNVGLFDGVMKYRHNDDTKDQQHTSLGTYLSIRIHGEIVDALRTEFGVQKRNKTHRLDRSLEGAETDGQLIAENIKDPDSDFVEIITFDSLDQESALRNGVEVVINGGHLSSRNAKRDIAITLFCEGAQALMDDATRTEYKKLEESLGGQAPSRKQIADHFGIDVSRVSQIYTRTIAQLSRVIDREAIHI